ncbi:serine threonine-protein kinase [Musa troglodytarum]|uniref:Receptor-like serine/threonine-protein kinase n=1 Tax=Musa troglodytarum TaxID=320322 RepID=A0A9E7KZS1_9LILI|nr:serine threonine-protein kinase [Musa troglodytarum]URE35332.1 serine threonine-protein kinase [Musa troglodytarum]URE35334.1 serine threonine-protein kinase [Musa troglodytarum]
MMRLPLYVVIFLLSSLSLLLLGASDDRLTPGEFISLNETLVSDAGGFVFGFFSPTNSTGDFYAGVWYNIPQRTVIWVANREKPINDSSATLRISDDSNLVIMDSEGGIFWSSNLSGFGTPGNDTAAVLLNSGDLVLRANSDNILWQSFDHPTDTFVPGMKIQYNYGNHSTRYITSWKDANDPSPGNFSLGIDSRTPTQLLIWSGTKLYWRSQVWSGKMFTGSRAINTTAVAYLTVLADDDEIYITLSVSDASLYVRYTLNYLGQIELLSWDNSSKNWTKYSSMPNYKCETYGWCGQFTYCDSTESVPACKCMEGFEPKVQSDWETGNFSAGCIRKKALRCGDGDGFLRVEGMKLPDHVVFLRNRNIRDCRTACLTNCSCTAYAYSDVTTGNATVSQCLVWVGELIDTEMVRGGGEDLYLRLMDISLGTSGSKMKTRRIVLIVSLSAIVVSLACIFILWKFSEVLGVFKDRKKGKLLTELSSSTDFANNISGSNEFIEGQPHQGPELPLIGFENILFATNNFSDSNKLGQGGFGIVYKGNLPGGQEIAVKRLLRGSRQGLEEFKTEVILIAKLQHRNLVKLLACCIHGEEKLLVYEFMPNKSLDFFLFDPTQKAKLDWGKRFNIIKGIARALLYLHQDSRLRIIHRDLKASNILLDAEMNPKISDFGMARIFGGNQDEANTNTVVGTYGYMSPEYAMEGLFSVKSDVYSYGVLLLEIVSGFRNTSFHFIMDFPNLLAYAWKLWNEGKANDCVDSSIADACSPTEVLRSIHVGLLCVQDSPNDRPAMSSVVFMLENEEATISAAPKQPIFTIQRNLNPDTGHPPDGSYEVYSYNNVTVTAAEGR